MLDEEYFSFHLEPGEKIAYAAKGPSITKYLGCVDIGDDMMRIKNCRFYPRALSEEEVRIIHEETKKMLEKEEDHTGQVYNPITGEWKWL